MPQLVQVSLTAVAVAALTVGSAIAQAQEDSQADGNAYVVTPLVSNLPASAATHDPVLQNAWGIVFSPAGSPFWVNDNDTGCSTLYAGDGTKLGLQVSIPLPGGVIAPNSCLPFDFNNPPATTPAAPTGIVWNPRPSSSRPRTAPSPRGPAG